MKCQEKKEWNPTWLSRCSLQAAPLCIRDAGVLTMVFITLLRQSHELFTNVATSQLYKVACTRTEYISRKLRTALFPSQQRSGSEMKLFSCVVLLTRTALDTFLIIMSAQSLNY